MSRLSNGAAARCSWRCPEESGVNAAIKTAALAACLAGFAGAATDDSSSRPRQGDDFLLQTKSTTLALRRENGSWNVAHYGARVESAADVAALAWNRWTGGHKYEQRRPAAYAAYGGDKEGGYGFNKWGGLQVTHADGCPTLHLVGEKAQTVPDAPGVTHLVLAQKDRAYPFWVFQHFRAFEACDVIETWVELKNAETGAVKLGRMDSFAMDFPLLQPHGIRRDGFFQSQIRPRHQHLIKHLYPVIADYLTVEFFIQ